MDIRHHANERLHKVKPPHGGNPAPVEINSINITPALHEDVPWIHLVGPVMFDTELTNFLIKICISNHSCTIPVQCPMWNK